ncbi:NAD-dependent epimerase/dehydratase family protein [Candidatus Woesearchaeota archaeon]|nr:NAD-dependent epimerase/dehydratase family protein [Candidatus Woesearchaeota archaeon]
MTKNKASVLFTGAAGFIGSHTVDKLLSEGYFVVGVDNLLTGKMENLKNALNNPNFRFIKGNIQHKKFFKNIFWDYKFDYIFHYAAVVGVERTLQKGVSVLHDIYNMENICKFAADNGVKRVLYSSSSEVYGDPVHYPQNEDDTPLNARLPYAAVKSLSEVWLQTYAEKYGFGHTIFRFFNTYGPRQSPDFVMSRFIIQALKGWPITIYGDGNQTRTFCYVKDNTNFTTSCLANDETCNTIINVGSNIPITIKELAKLVKRLSNSTSSINYLPARKKGDMKGRQPCIKKFIKWYPKPFVPLEEGILRTIKYFKEQGN